jgi:hypothetical protein
MISIPKNENQYIEFKAESVKAVSLAEEIEALGAVHYDITEARSGRISDLDMSQIGEYF